MPAAGQHVVITNVGTQVLLTNSTANLASFTITGDDPTWQSLTFSNWNTTLNASNVTIQSFGKLTLPDAFTESQMSNRVHIVCTNFSLESGGSINVDSKGYIAGNGPGKGEGTAAYNGGGGYGGKGGDGTKYAGGTTYGSASAPIDPGSSGGKNGSGNNGGGAVRIEAAGNVTVNGTITANGGNGQNGYAAGGGSGGAIYITCGTFGGSTNGILCADGGDESNPPDGGAGGGGGGRIAVWYGVPENRWGGIRTGNDMRRVSIITNASEYSEFPGTVSVTNGTGWTNNPAEPGTIVFLTVTPPSGMMFMCQ